MKTITHAEFTRNGDIITKIKEVSSITENESGYRVITTGKEETVMVPVGMVDGDFVTKNVGNEKVYTYLADKGYEMHVKKFEIL